MKELSKSILSFSWALSLIGIKQAASMVTPGSRAPSTSAVFDPITETAVGQLDESMKGIFRSGEAMQGKMVDMMFGMFTPGNWSAMRSAGNCGRNAAAGFTPPPPSAAGPGFGPGPSAPPPVTNATTAGSSAGWGPMPGDTSQ
jgi:hypothetical protein